MRRTEEAFSLTVSIARQRLTVSCADRAVREYPVSTAANGVGEQFGSGCTPRGLHVVRARVGAGCASGTVFVGRRPTGEIHSTALARLQPQRDWILTRILWLAGCEPGLNRFGAVDTLRRFIYIHGCPDDVPMGVPASHGCIRMRNADVIALFDQVRVGTPVRIEAS
ncbi:MAG: L,D-transpeptidase [Variovorax sp.]|nr:MAG: L,D-transpeptidase [Variovorax sp.]